MKMGELKLVALELGAYLHQLITPEMSFHWSNCNLLGEMSNSPSKPIAFSAF